MVKLLKRNGGNREDAKWRPYTKNEIDAVIAYLPVTGKLYWFDPDIWDGRSAFMLRYAPSKNNQKAGVNDALRYEW